MDANKESLARSFRKAEEMVLCIIIILCITLEKNLGNDDNFNTSIKNVIYEGT